MLAIGAFALVLNLIEKHGLVDEQFGDTGDWGEDGAQYLLIGDNIYVTDDDIDAYLIAGTDDMKVDEEKGYSGEMADFLTLLIIDDTTKKYGFYQIDRNSITDVIVLDKDGNEAGTAKEQITIAHWYGTNAEQRNKNTANTVSKFFGDLRVNGYYVMNMADIGTVNNAIGGVQIDFDEDLTEIDPAFTKGASVLLDDKQAEKYVRARQGVGTGSNVERMGRQRHYMEAAYSRVLNQLRENPEYISDLHAQLEGVIDSDLQDKDISTISNRIINYESADIITFDGEKKYGETLGDGKTYEEFYVDPESMLEGLRKVMNLELDNSDDEEEVTEEEEDNDSDEYVVDAEDFEELTDEDM